VPRVEPIIVERPHPNGPFGAIGVGEVGSIAAAAALGNAVCRATGVRIRDLPLSAERVLGALQAEENDNV
jgi:carbon-monoxide dehydrogenase large subunit